MSHAIDPVKNLELTRTSGSLRIDGNNGNSNGLALRQGIGPFLLKDPIGSAICRRILGKVIEGLFGAVEAMGDEMAAIVGRKPVRLARMALCGTRPRSLCLIGKGTVDLTRVVQFVQLEDIPISHDLAPTGRADRSRRCGLDRWP